MVARSRRIKEFGKKLKITITCPYCGGRAVSWERELFRCDDCWTVFRSEL